MQINITTPQYWKDYELIDCGGFEKLERFGDFITIRPEPQALWNKTLKDSEWKNLAHVQFIAKSSSSGEWKKLKSMPDNWTIHYKLAIHQLKFNLALTKFKHIGIFPEQADNWEYIFNNISKMPVQRPKVLNLFAYTGGASLAACAAGAEVYHVDSIKQVVSWANKNMESSSLKDIRWVVEDAMKFVHREVKRGKRYHGIILDPPAYGHGPNGESWKLEEQLNEMMQNVFQLLEPQHHFLVLNSYSLGLSTMILENLFINNYPFSKLEPEFGELYLPFQGERKLPLGIYCRFSNLQSA
jgi:23S rRNA (cytosine1962-C5)-methyltransferase